MAALGKSSGSKYKNGLHHFWWSNMSRLAPREVADRGHETPAQRAVAPPPHFDHVWRLPYVAVRACACLHIFLPPSRFCQSCPALNLSRRAKPQTNSQIPPSRQKDLLSTVSTSCEGSAFCIIRSLPHNKGPEQSRTSVHFALLQVRSRLAVLFFESLPVEEFRDRPSNSKLGRSDQRADSTSTCRALLHKHRK
jgi:hypothetical protein